MLSCGHSIDNIKEEIQIFKNNTKHLRMSCNLCNRFIGYKQQDLPENYTLSFGKYKGLSIDQIKIKDHSYLSWLLEQEIKDNLRKHKVNKIK